jgi:hypothetical protein
MAGAAEFQPEQMRQRTDSLAALTQQVHQLSVRRRTQVALHSVDSQRRLRETERIMERLRPHLDNAEQRLVERLEQMTLDQADGPETKKSDGPAASTEEKVGELLLPRGLPVHKQTISGRENDHVGDAPIDPPDPTWVKRTVFVKDIELESANVQTVKDVCSRIRSAEGDPDDLIVNVSLRRKTDRQKGSWALVSFAAERGAQKLIDEQQRKVVFRLTRSSWTFLPYKPKRLQSHEAQASQFHSAQNAERWTQSGLVGHAIHTMKQSRQASALKRTIWVGGVPDHLARGGRERFEQNVKLIFGEFGQVEQVKTRYKDVNAGSAGTSWCTVTFANQATASDVLARTVSVPADGAGRTARAMVQLQLKTADARAKASPIGETIAQGHIDAIHKAIVTYKASLPAHHPTLVRMHAALAELHRQCSDEEAALYAQQEAQRQAKSFLLELARVGEWGVYTEDESFMRALLKDDKQVEDLFRRRRELAEDQPGSEHEQPTRQWADG